MRVATVIMNVHIQTSRIAKSKVLVLLMTDVVIVVSLAVRRIICIKLAAFPAKKAPIRKTEIAPHIQRTGKPGHVGGAPPELRMAHGLGAQLPPE